MDKILIAGLRELGVHGVLPEEQHQFDRVVMQIRTNVSEWLWLNVLTRKDVEDAVDSLYVFLSIMSRALANIMFQSKLLPPTQRRIQLVPHSRDRTA